MIGSINNCNLLEEEVSCCFVVDALFVFVGLASVQK